MPPSPFAAASGASSSRLPVVLGGGSWGAEAEALWPLALAACLKSHFPPLATLRTGKRLARLLLWLARPA